MNFVVVSVFHYNNFKLEKKINTIKYCNVKREYLFHDINDYCFAFIIRIFQSGFFRNQSEQLVNVNSFTIDGTSTEMVIPHTNLKNKNYFILWILKFSIFQLRWKFHKLYSALRNKSKIINHRGWLLSFEIWKVSNLHYNSNNQLKILKIVWIMNYS